MELHYIFLLAFICIIVIGVYSVKLSNRAEKRAPNDLGDAG